MNCPVIERVISGVLGIETKKNGKEYIVTNSCSYDISCNENKCFPKKCAMKKNKKRAKKNEKKCTYIQVTEKICA